MSHVARGVQAPYPTRPSVYFTHPDVVCPSRSNAAMHAMDKVVWVGDDDTVGGIWKCLKPDLMLTLKRLQSLLLLAIEYKKPYCDKDDADIDRWVPFP